MKSATERENLRVHARMFMLVCVVLCGSVSVWVCGCACMPVYVCVCLDVCAARVTVYAGMLVCV